MRTVVEIVLEKADAASPAALSLIRSSVQQHQHRPYRRPTINQQYTCPFLNENNVSIMYINSLNS